MYFSIHRFNQRPKCEGILYDIGWIKKTRESKRHPKTHILEIKI